MLRLTCEAKAAERRTLYFISKCVLDFDTEKPYWKCVSDFEDLTDESFKFDTVTEFIQFVSGVPVAVIRQIARSGSWRVRYAAGKKLGVDLFGRAIKDFTVDQLNLIQWSDYYAGINEMLPEDRPPESIIEDDVALDAYMEEYFEERNREDVARKHSKGRSSKMKSAFDHDEVIVTKAHPLYKDIKYSKTPKKLQDSEKVTVTEKEQQGREKYIERRKGSTPSKEDMPGRV